tara:strand:- start:122 stop:490 length:369 start_codon:yes stop_codon:yes gene_type:complete
MATLSVQPVIEAGVTPTYASAASGGDVAPNDGTMFIHVKNEHGSATRTITFTPSTTSVTDDNYGAVTKAAVALTVAAGGDEFIGPFKTTLWNNGSGQVAITYSDSGANIKLAALSFDKDKIA